MYSLRALGLNSQHLGCNDIPSISVQHEGKGFFYHARNLKARKTTTIKTQEEKKSQNSSKKYQTQKAIVESLPVKVHNSIP